MKNTSGSSLQTLLLLFTLPGAVQLASAASDSWTGNIDANWSTPGNWTGGNAPPLAGDTLLFGASTPTTLNNDLTAGLAFIGLTFSGGSAFTLNGNGILLSGSANNNTIGILNNSGLTQALGTLPLALDRGYYTFSTPSGGSLALNGGLAAGAGGVAYFDANVTSTSLTADGVTGLITGLEGAGLLYDGGITPTGLAAISGGVISAYSGYTTLASGAISSGNNIELTASGAAAAYSASGISVNTIRATQAGNGTGTFTDTLTTTGTLTLGNKGGIYVLDSAAGAKSCLVLTGGALTAGTAGTPATLIFGVNGDNANNQMQMGSALQDNGTGGAVTVVKVGSGSMFFSGANSYTGGTYVDQGELQGNNVGSFSATGPIYVAAGATLYITPSGTVANPITLSPGHGTSYNVGATTGSALVLGGAGNTLSGMLTLQGAPVTTTSSTAIGASLGDRITLVEGGNSHSFNINGQLTGTGTLELYCPLHSENFFLGNSSLVNPNTWTGGLILETPQNTFSKLNAGNQLNGGSVTLIGASTKSCRLDLNGFSDTFGGLIAADNTANQLDNFGATSCTLILGARDASGTFGGTMADGGASKALNLVKIGAGTQTLRGANTCFGTVTISNGTFALAGGGTLPNAPTITIASGATFDASGIGGFTAGPAQTLAGLGTLVGSTLINGTVKPFMGTIGTLTNNGSVSFNGGGTYVWDINNATGTPGTDSGWGLLKIVGGGLDITATSGSQFNIKITSLTAGDVPGNAANFNPNVSTNWTLVQADSPITGFDPAAVHLDTTGFSNPQGSGSFSIGLSGDQLRLVLSFSATAVITTPLVNQTNCAGSTATFTVVANGASLPLSFQWLQGSTVLVDGTTTSSGATVAISTSGHTSTLTLGGVQDADTGGYTVNVTNNVGAAGLSSATLTVLDPPSNLSVVQSPSSTISAGGITRFTVTADGSPPFTYAWSRNGTPLVNGGAFSGANTATLAVNVSPATAGSYTVVVGNGCNSATSVASVLGGVTTVPGQIIYEPFTSYVPQVFRPAFDTWEGVTNLFNELTGEPAWWFHASGSGIQMIVQANDMGDGVNNQNGGSYPMPGLAGNSANCLYWNESLNSHLEFAQNGFAPGTTVYVSFTLSCVSLGSANGVMDVIAAFCSPNDTTAYNWKLCTQVSDFAANQYLLGLAKANGRTGSQGVDANTTWMSTPLTAQQDVLVVGAYTVNSGGTLATDDAVSLWVNPDPSTFSAASAPTPTIGPSTFGVANSAIRDFSVHSVAAPASHRIADLRIGTTWASVTPPAAPTLTLANVYVPVGANAVFASQNAGNPVDTYQWRFNGGSPLSDNAHYSGTATATLTIIGVTSGDVGTYTVTGSNTDPLPPNGILTGSASAILSTQPPSLKVTASGLNAIVSWPTNWTGFILEQTPSLSPTTWTTNSLPPYAVLGPNNLVTNPLSATEFFRLINH